MKNTMILFLLVLLFASISYSQDATTYSTIDEGDWTVESIWVDGNVPPNNGTISNNSIIKINHDVTLYGDFIVDVNSFTLYVNQGNTLIITGDVNSTKNMKTYIQETATFQVGTPPDHCTNYDFCTETSSNNCNYENSEYYVGGSSNSSLSISGLFHLYGDFVVENKFDIQVESRGGFIVEGSFTAKNQAEVSFTGEGENTSSGSIGCNMNFINSAIVSMVGATLDIGGSMLFGNSSDIYIVGSTLNVTDSICSFEGRGSGALITIHSEYSDGSAAPPGDDSQVNSGHFCNEVLPIELLSFTAETIRNQVNLQWSTATETNNDYYTIERSVDLQVWELVAQVRGAGNSNQVLHYSMTDANPLPGLNYYKLKQTDFDGQYEYFGPLPVMIEAVDELDFSVIKRPSEWIIQLQGTNDCQIEIYTLSGQKVLSQQVSVSISIQAPAQAVVIRVITPGNQAVAKIIM